ncbi:MAG: hypothetical protein COB38_09915 [Gammaproteobacteria bacterium]|nr:MAG: hypothetical protein COB38_09915 [Gammaproteobacteria bacterium]
MKTLFNKLIIISSIIFLSLFSFQASAADLSSAKKAGIIGEQASGYIGFVKSAPSDVKQLVASVNKKRKARYQNIAKSKKIALSEVAKVGGAKAMSKTARGNYIKPQGKGWVKK